VVAVRRPPARRGRAAGARARAWSPGDATLLRAADELHEQSKVSDGTWERLAETYDERGLIEIAMLVGHYHMVAFALNSLEVELDEGLEGLP
jgi:4-carboxymuconolactone decarboxylase